MARVIACIIARTVSTRLPLKVLRDLCPQESMIEFLIKRVKSVREVDEVYLCTSEEAVDDILEDVALRSYVKIYRGSPDEVIERMIAVGEMEQADIVIRITGDNPFCSTEYIKDQISFLNSNNLDYVRIVDIPIGATPEVISFNALKDCYSKMDKSVSEYLMLFLFEPATYNCGIIKLFDKDYSHYTVTVDTPIDLERSRLLLTTFSNKNKTEITLKQIIEIYCDSSILLPEKSISPSGSIKLPYNKVISFEDFQADITRRKSGSKELYLDE